MECLVQLPDLMQRGREALKRPDVSRFALLEVRSELRSLYQAYQPILKTIRERLRAIDAGVAAGSSLTSGVRRMIHCHHSRMLAFGLTIGVALACVLGAIEKDSDQLREESAHMSREILELAEVVTVYRPLGALLMTVSLVAAWVGTSDTVLRARIKASLVDYLRDIRGPTAALATADLEGCLKHFTLR